MALPQGEDKIKMADTWGVDEKDSVQNNGAGNLIGFANSSNDVITIMTGLPRNTIHIGHLMESVVEGLTAYSGGNDTISDSDKSSYTQGPTYMDAPENRLVSKKGPAKKSTRKRSPKKPIDSLVKEEVRKSQRDRPKTRRLYSPELSPKGKKKRKHGILKVKRGFERAEMHPVRAFDVGPDGRPFSCDICKSPYVCNPAKRGPRVKMSNSKPSPRHKLDPCTSKLLVLCNACGLAFDRPLPNKKEKVPPPLEDKEKYLKEADSFAMSLVKILEDEDAKRLSCPHFKNKACGCIQRFVVGEDEESSQRRERAEMLLNLLKEAKKLSSKKCYDVEIVPGQRQKKPRNIGMGNGQRKSKDFEDFVMDKRQYLRDEIKLCERAIQRVLMYSNNFLHKRLKTDERGFRATRVKGKSILGLLKPIKELYKEKCCTDQCVLLCLTHEILLEKWRERSQDGQAEARRVLAEMLTPTGGSRSNCYKFISMVTGCSTSTIGSVNEQMKRTGGDREPPEHGLKKYWQQVKSKPGSEASEVVVVAEDNNSVPSDEENGVVDLEMLQNVPLSTDKEVDIGAAPEPLQGMEKEVPVVELLAQDVDLKDVHIDVELQLQRNQLLELQQQVEQQQIQLQQQQELLQQQLLKHVILQRAKQTSGTSPQENQVMEPNIVLLPTQSGGGDNLVGGVRQLNEGQSYCLAYSGGALQPNQIITIPHSRASGDNNGQVPETPITSIGVPQSSPSIVTLSSGAQVILQPNAPLDLDSAFARALFPSVHLHPDMQQAIASPSPNEILSSENIPLGTDVHDHLEDKHGKNIMLEGSVLEGGLHEIDAELQGTKNNTDMAIDTHMETGVSSGQKLLKSVMLSDVKMEGNDATHHSLTGDSESLDADSNPGAKAVVQQILDFTQLTGVPGQNTISISPSQMSTLLSQLTETSSTVAPNVNIAYIHHLQNTPSGGTTPLSESDIANLISGNVDGNTSCTILEVQSSNNASSPITSPTYDTIALDKTTEEHRGLVGPDPLISEERHSGCQSSGEEVISQDEQMELDNEVMEITSKMNPGAFST